MSALLGLFVPSLLIISWTVSLGLACCLDLDRFPLLGIIVVIALRTFFHTGLFVTAHDAMHGTVSIAHPNFNHTVGKLCSFLYAFLPYSFLQTKHRLHHLYPASDQDPDFCQRNIGQWYLRFMGSYLLGTATGGEQRWHVWTILTGMASVLVGLHLLAQVQLNNLLLFWMLPIWLSSVQLFYFGTFLPHHSPEQLDGHRARSSNFTWAWSFLTCYHLGYHWEHHEYPHLPWYALPSVKKM